MTMNRRTIPLQLLSLLVLILGFPTSPELSAQQKKPNILIIMADDLGYGDISPYDGWVNTPHLEKLAEQGVLLTDYHSNGAVCSPTRAAMMTGRYQQRANIPGVVYAAPNRGTHNHGLQPKEYTIAEALSDAGYVTGMFGKWHLGYYRPYNPIHHGFDRYRGFVSGNIDYFAKVDQAGHYDWWLNDRLINEKGYVPHRIADHSVKFIQNHADEPFFLYVAHGVPHYPYQGPKDQGFRVPGRGMVRMDQNSDRKKRAYRQMVKALDQSVGRIMKTLEEEGIANNTFLFVTSDNGPAGPGSSGPLRANKGNVFEGGHRVPAIARYPGLIPSGTETNEPVMGMDLMPTAIELAGATLPDGLTLDGIDVMPALTGSTLPERDLIWISGRRAAFRRGPWKLVLQESGLDEPALFHLGQDRSESNDLSGDHPERVKRLRNAFQSLRTELHESATDQPEGSKPPPGSLSK